MRTCTKCGDEKELSDFSKTRRTYRFECKTCQKNRVNTWRANKWLEENSGACQEIFINKCKQTGDLFVSRKPNERYSQHGKAIRELLGYPPSYRWPKTEHLCEECRDSFKGTPKSKFCSKECSYKHNKRIARIIEKA